MMGVERRRARGGRRLQVIENAAAEQPSKKNFEKQFLISFYKKNWYTHKVYTLISEKWKWTGCLLCVIRETVVLGGGFRVVDDVLISIFDRHV